MTIEAKKAEILDWCSQRVECLARRKIIDEVGTLDAAQSSPVTETVVGDMRPSKYPEQNPDSKTWTAGIDIFRKYDYCDEAWHLSAIEFHHKDKAEALALRDKAYAALSKPGLAPTAQQQALVEFFKWAMREGPWEGGDLDGGSIQDKAESLGLIVQTKFDPAKHGTAYGDFSEGDNYYEFAPGLADTPPVREAE
jgi:hypothetical protein